MITARRATLHPDAQGSRGVDRAAGWRLCTSCRLLTARASQLLNLQNVQIEHAHFVGRGAVQSDEVASKAHPRPRTSWEMDRVRHLGLPALCSALRPAHTSALQNEHFSAEWFMQLRSHRAVVLRLSCSQYVVGSLVSTGDYQEQQYQPPLCRGPEAPRYSAERLQNDAVLLMLTRVLMATRHSKASMACPHTLEEMIPTLCGVPAQPFDVVGEALNGSLSKQGLNL